MPRPTLRPYQRTTVEKTLAELASGVQRPANVLATGAGKTIVLTELAAQLHVPREQTLVLAHRRELIEQNAAKLREGAPHLRIGTMIGGPRLHLGHDIISGSVQTVVNRLDVLPRVKRIIVDECHHATAPTYRKILDHFGAFSPGGAVAIGFTATMSRADKAGLGDIWQTIAHTVGIAELIADGYLVRPYGKRIVLADLDLRAVRTKAAGGDFQDGSLGQALEDAGAPDAIAHAYREHASDRQGIVFMPTVHSAMETAEAFRLAGFTTAVVYGDMSTDDRRGALAAYRAGAVQVLVNCMVLTEGTDLPMTSCIVVARPTKSSSLYVQMAGRGLRLHHESGKTDCLILDVAGVTRNMRLASPIDLFTSEELAREKPDGFEDWEEEEADALEWEEEAQPDVPLKPSQLMMRDWSGRLTVEEVDLFGVDARTGYAWEMTRGGTWFLAVGYDHYLTVVKSPIPTLWDVMRVHKHERGNSTWVARTLPLAQAMQAAENAIQSHERAASKESRRRRRELSGNLANYAASLGIEVTPSMTGGEVSTLVDIALASARLDSVLHDYARR